MTEIAGENDGQEIIRNDFGRNMSTTEMPIQMRKDMESLVGLIRQIKYLQLEEKEMMTNEELAAFEEDNEYPFYKTVYVSYPEYTMIYMLKSPKTCAVNGIKDVKANSINLDIPSSVEIEGNTYWVNEIFEEGFWDNGNIEAVIIPDTVTCIYRGAFQGCHRLKSVYIPDSVTFIDEIAFACCDSLESVSIPGGDIELGDECFDECPLLTITKR